MPRAPNVSRTKAQKIITEVFGKRFLARRKAKSAPGGRCEIARRKTVPPFRAVVVGRGETWLDAVIDAATALRLPDVVKTAEDIKLAYVAEEPVIG